MRKLKGDTLIEVTLAVGIFSMVAIAVVSVVNGSTSGAQSALETTLTRSEIDSQAEALRFVQSAYINSNTATNEEPNEYKTIWRAIKARANDPDSSLDFSPRTCKELYDREEGQPSLIASQKAFVLNPRQLGLSANNVVVSAQTGSQNKFFSASTYPRLIYSGSSSDDSVIEDAENVNSDLSRVEGIYIIAVKGPKTVIVSNGSAANASEPAYYDFYIRSCWYASGADTPSVISTVMRLYDPDVVKVDSPN